MRLRRFIGIACKKEVDEFFESLHGVWDINDFSCLPLLDLNESYVLNEDMNTVDSTLGFKEFILSVIREMRGVVSG